MNAKMKKDILASVDFLIGICDDFPSASSVAALVRAQELRAEVEALPVEVELTPAFEYERVLHCPECGSDDLTLWDNEFVGWRLTGEVSEDGAVARYEGGSGEFEGRNEVHCGPCCADYAMPSGFVVDWA